MAKKFGKFLLFTAAVGSAAAAVYYYMQKKDSAVETPADEDYDDLSEELDDKTESSRNYVSLNTDTKTEPPSEEQGSEEQSSKEQSSKERSSFVPLSEQVKNAEETVEEEEFFDEEDPADDSAPVGEH
ncbi:MAG: hypothetical protein NC420_05300 [Eubacterium sp.]|nr:hypothetical protein [Eubacterium sp.]MCM1303229.1 hypothetical protein [Butyrivibrio sp.]MCM1343194.1 hypothetical protein [Muribaculaceae bacterium]MCM1409544.1 hypothetical protein [Lachnospiraceae bacterium]